MPMSMPSPTELNELSAQVDSQFGVLLATTPLSTTRGAGPARRLPPAPLQEALIEQASGEPFESFWQKYLRHAKRDLCVEGGVLHGQWKKWRDLQSREVVRISYACLATMGISTANLAPVAVATAAIVLNAAVKIGLDALCEDCH